MSPDLANEKGRADRMDQACERIGEVCGPDVLRSVEEGAFLGDRRQVQSFAALDDATMVELLPLIEEGFTVALAVQEAERRRAGKPARRPDPLSSPAFPGNQPTNIQDEPTLPMSNNNLVPAPTAILPPPVSLSDAERTRLADAENVVHAGLQTVWQVGSALATIRDEKLYREEHTSFESYLRARWNISRPSAYRLIDAAAVRENLLSPIGDTAPEATRRLPANEAQSRPLAALEPEQQREAWTAAFESSNGQPTAAHVKAAVAKLPKEISQAVAAVESGEKTMTAAVSGKPAPATKLGAAWTNIEKVVGKELAAALRATGELEDRRNALKVAELPDARMREATNLVAAGWPLKRALQYRDYGAGGQADGWNSLDSLVAHAVASGKNEYEGVFYPEELQQEEGEEAEWIVIVRPKNPPPKAK